LAAPVKHRPPELAAGLFGQRPRVSISTLGRYARTCGSADRHAPHGEPKERAVSAGGDATLPRIAERVRPPMLPPKDRLTVCFAHVAYRLRERFDARGAGVASFE